MRLKGRSSQILDAAREKGIVLDGPVGAVPEIWGFARPYWDAWEMLNPRRPLYVGTGVALPGGLAVSEIRAVAPLFGFVSEDLEFCQIIAALDTEWRVLQDQQRLATTPSKP